MGGARTEVLTAVAQGGGELETDGVRVSEVQQEIVAMVGDGIAFDCVAFDCGAGGSPDPGVAGGSIDVVGSSAAAAEAGAEGAVAVDQRNEDLAEGKVKEGGESKAAAYPVQPAVSAAAREGEASGGEAGVAIDRKVIKRPP